jgi:hypothetical protein
MKWDSSSCLLSNKYYDDLHMYTHKIGFISLSVIGVAAVLMVVTAPTFENQQASAVSQPVVKKVSVKDPPSKKGKDPPRKRFVRRCAFIRGKRVCRLIPVHFRGPLFRHPGIRPPIGSVRPPMGVRPPIGSVRPSSAY